jgi:hypothetical protein
LKILFCLYARLGDVCCGIPAFLGLREKYPKAELTWSTLKQYESLIPKCGKVRPFGSPPFGSYPPWAKSPDYDLVIKAQPMWRHREWEQSKTHAVDLICRWAGVSPKIKYVALSPSLDDFAVVRKMGLPKNFVTICSSPCYSCANWPYQHRQTIVDALRKRGIDVLTVGGKDGQALKGARICHGRLSYLQTAALIGLSKLYIGPDNGVSWLAMSARNTARLCVIDKNRLRQGVVGFQGYLTDGNIRDSFYQDGVGTHVNLANELWDKK